MTYNLAGDNLLFALDRTRIVDISPGDVISVDGFPGLNYVWTNHDSEFLENNPDDEVYLEARRAGKNEYEATGILLKENNKA